MRKQETKTMRRQAGVTLMELIASLAIMAVIITGALSLYTSASTSQSTTQLVQDLAALRSSTKATFMGQGGYGASSVIGTLNTAKRLPTTITVGAGPSYTHVLGGPIDVTGATSEFLIQVDNIPQNVCIALLTSAQGWLGVKPQGSASTEQTTFPISPSTAASACNATTASNDMIFRAN